MIIKATKKPVQIEAMQLTEESFFDVALWVGNDCHHFKDYLEIVTLEGDMRADIGDYIIKGVNDEFYPCKPDIFEKTYSIEGEE